MSVVYHVKHISPTASRITVTDSTKRAHSMLQFRHMPCENARDESNGSAAYLKVAMGSSWHFELLRSSQWLRTRLVCGSSATAGTLITLITLLLLLLTIIRKRRRIVVPFCSIYVSRLIISEHPLLHLTSKCSSHRLELLQTGRALLPKCSRER